VDQYTGENNGDGQTATIHAVEMACFFACAEFETVSTTKKMKINRFRMDRIRAM
jgi:hypothetical protein